MITDERLTTDLDELFRPCSLERFLASACGKSYYHVPGTPGKFAGLLPWPRLNRLLREHWLEPPRIRLGMKGNEVLEDGDLLYIPRGWRHMVVPLAEPTLHLSFDWRNPTGHDFLRWLQQELHAHPVLSRDLPAAGDAAGEAEYIERLRAELMD